MLPVLVNQPYVPDADVAHNVFSADSGEVGLRLEAEPGDFPPVEVEGVEVGVSEVRVELVDGVLRFRGECEYSLEEKVEIRVGADYSSVEGVAEEGSGGCQSAVVVSVEPEPVHEERIDGDPGSVPAQSRPAARPEAAFADWSSSDDLAYVNVGGADCPLDFHRPVFVYQVLDGQCSSGISDS